MSKEDVQVEEAEVVETNATPTEPEESYEDPIDSLEDDDTSFEDVEDDDSDEVETEEDESETDSEDEPQPEEDEPESTEDEGETESVESEEADTASEEQEPTDDSTEKSKEEIAQEAFKRREAERQLREEREARERRDLEAYLEAAKDDEQELSKRRNEVERHLLNKERSTVLQDKLDVSMQRAVKDFGLDKADDATKNFIARQLDKFEASNIVRDQRGNIIEVKGDVYQSIKEEIDSISQFRDIGAREQTKKKAAQKQRVVPKPTRTPKEAKKDEDLADFDSAFYGEDY